MRHGVDYPSCIHDRIHPCIEEEATLSRYTTSHMKIEHEENQAPKITK